jgi:hypothetical protein
MIQLQYYSQLGSLVYSARMSVFETHDIVIVDIGNIIKFEGMIRTYIDLRAKFINQQPINDDDDPTDRCRPVFDHDHGTTVVDY